MDSLLHPQISYAGEFVHTLDGKNRITVPSRWRDETKKEGEEFVVLPSNDETYLRVMIPAEFNRMSADVKANPEIEPREKTIYLRDLHSTAEHAFSDKQGRLVLPEDLCQLTGLKGEVTLVGNLGSFEIWNSARRKQTKKEHRGISQRVADKVGH